MSRRAGMTLLEVLVAVSLLALLSVGMLYSVNAGLGSLSSINRRVDRIRKASGAHRILEQQFASFLPVVAPCGVALTEGHPTAAYFFQGEPAVMRFVSAYSLEEAGRGHPRILEFFTIRTPDGEGLRLIVNEVPYFSPLSAGVMCTPAPPDPQGGPPSLLFPAPQATPRSFILADRLASVSFAYQQPIREAPYAQWVPRWLPLSVLPTAVRIEMRPLPTGAIQLPALPFYARIEPDRSVNEGLE